MNTTTITRVDSIIKYIVEDEGDNAEFALRNLDMTQDGEDSAGTVIHASACNAEGYYEPLQDCTLIIPDNWDGVLRKSNNGWEWLGCDKCEIDEDMIRGMVALDKSLDSDQVDARTVEICDELEIAHA